MLMIIPDVVDEMQTLYPNTILDDFHLMALVKSEAIPSVKIGNISLVDTQDRILIQYSKIEKSELPPNRPLASFWSRRGKFQALFNACLVEFNVSQEEAITQIFDDREADIFKALFLNSIGKTFLTDNGERATLQSLADKWHISRERVRQITEKCERLIYRYIKINVDKQKEKEEKERKEKNFNVMAQAVALSEIENKVQKRDPVYIHPDSATLETMGLSTRVCNWLHRSHIHTAGTIRGLSESNLIRIHNLGAKSRAEIHKIVYEEIKTEESEGTGNVVD